MSGQITWFPSLQEKIDKRNATEAKLKRNWENAFQKRRSDSLRAD